MATGVKEKLAAPPFIAQLELLSKMVKRLMRHRMISVYQCQHGERSQEFSDYRLYRPGDDLQRLDWNVYRRLNELVVKEYVREAPVQWVIMLDADHSMRMYHKLHFAKKISAALAYIGVTTVQSVTFCLASGQKKILCRNKREIKTLLHFLDELEQLEPKKVCEQRRLISGFPTHAMVMYIGDYYRDYRSILSSFQWKSMKGIALHVIAGQERNPHFSGNVTLQQVNDSRQHKMMITPSVIKNYQKKFHHHVESVKNYCRRHQVFHCELSPELPLEKTILDILKYTGVLH